MVMPHRIRAEILRRGDGFTLYVWGSGGPDAWFGRKVHRGVTPIQALTELGKYLMGEDVVVMTKKESKKKKGGKHGKSTAQERSEVDGQ